MGLPLDETLVLQSVADQIGNADQPQPPLIGVLPQFGQTGHRSIGVLDLTDHPSWAEAGQFREIDGGFGVAGPLQHAPLSSPQRKDVARPPQFGRSRGWIESHLDGSGAIFSGDPGGHTVLNPGVDADGEGRLVGIGVAIHHEWQIQFVQTLALHGQADQTSGLRGHEIDRFGGGELGGADEIPFVLALLVINHHDARSVPDRGEGVRDGIEADAFGRAACQGSRGDGCLVIIDT